MSDIALIREALAYDPETGVFTWRAPASNRVRVGDVAGWASGGYWQIGLNGSTYRAHQLVWAWVTGTWPTHEVDHIDGDGLNNRFANLRDVPSSLNKWNVVAPRKDNTSGFRGVTRNGDRWQARIWVRNAKTHLGTFDTPEEASAAYWAAKAELHGEETYRARREAVTA